MLGRVNTKAEHQWVNKGPAVLYRLLWS